MKYKPPFKTVLFPGTHEVACIQDADGCVVLWSDVLALLNAPLESLVREGWHLEDVMNEGFNKEGPYTATVQRDGRGQFGPDNIKHGFGPTTTEAVLDAARKAGGGG